MEKEEMTLRDQFAMAAMPHIYSMLFTMDNYENMAKEAYKLADAMLKAREVNND